MRALSVGILVAIASCSKKDEPKAAPPSSAPASAIAQEQEAAPAASGLRRDDAGHFVPRTPAPPVNSAEIPPAPSREPDADLDPDDPARDYVVRYVRATRRYGDKTACVVVGKSTAAAAPKRVVEVKDDPKCGGTGALLDAFVVDVGADRLSKRDANVGEPLKAWPDGSDPEGPAKGVVEVDVAKSKLCDELAKLKLTPVRVQLYARGTYPVITLAGFRDPFAKDAREGDMKSAIDRVCAASDRTPMSLLGGIDRSTTLRVRCAPPGARWDRF